MLPRSKYHLAGHVIISIWALIDSLDESKVVCKSSLYVQFKQYVISLMLHM